MAIDSRKSWSIKGPNVVGELLAWVNLSDEERDLLASLHDDAVAASEAFALDFVDRVIHGDNTAEYAEPYPAEAIIGALAGWFADLFKGVYDEEYAQSRIRIGQVHVRLGLPVRYPIAMFDIVVRHGEAVAQKAGPKAVEAFRKALALDFAAFTQAYEENQLHHLSSTLGNERLARRLLTQGI